MSLRNSLVDIALEWQKKFGVAPQITSTLSEFDAAILIGMTENEYSEYMKDKTAVQKGFDFIFNGIRYQIKANRPSGKPRSEVSKVPGVSNYTWDKLIWILYDKNYVMQEAWEWDVNDYRKMFDPKISTTRQTGGLLLAYKARFSSRDLSPSLSLTFKPTAA